MIDLYWPQDTFIHRFSAGIKLFFFSVCGMAVFMISSVAILFVFLLLVVLLYQAVRIPLGRMLQQFRRISLFLVLVFVSQIIFTDFLTGCLIVLRLMLLFFLASLISLTTKVSDMVYTIEEGLRPLRHFGVNPEKLSMLSSMAIRFLPILGEIFNEICEAQRARGFEPRIITLAIPLMIRTIKMSEEISEALDARSYDADTRYGGLYDDSNVALKK